MSFILNYNSNDAQTFRLTLNDEVVYEYSTGLTYAFRFTNEQSNNSFDYQLNDLSTIDRYNEFSFINTGMTDLGWYRYEVNEMPYTSFFTGNFPASYPTIKIVLLKNKITLKANEYFTLKYLDDNSVWMRGFSGDDVMAENTIGMFVDSGNGVAGYNYAKDRWVVVKDTPSYDGNVALEIGKCYLDNSELNKNIYTGTTLKYVYKKTN